MNSHISLENLREEASFRYATEADCAELFDLYRLFYEEAVYKDYLDYDEEKVQHVVSHGIRTDERPHIVAVVDESVVGFLSFWFDRTFSRQPCMVLLEFYVHPDFRRSAIGRGLVALAVLEGRHAGAGAFHAPIASGMPAARTLINLFAKAGFEPLGWVMRRKL